LYIIIINNDKTIATIANGRARALVTRGERHTTNETTTTITIIIMTESCRRAPAYNITGVCVCVCVCVCERCTVTVIVCLHLKNKIKQSNSPGCRQAPLAGRVCAFETSDNKMYHYKSFTTIITLCFNTLLAVSHATLPPVNRQPTHYTRIHIIIIHNLSMFARWYNRNKQRRTTDGRSAQSVGRRATAVPHRRRRCPLVRRWRGSVRF